MNMNTPILKGDIIGKSLDDLYEQAHNIVEQFYGYGYEEFVEISVINARADVDYIENGSIGVESLVMGEPTFYATFEARLLHIP